MAASCSSSSPSCTTGTAAIAGKQFGRAEADRSKAETQAEPERFFEPASWCNFHSTSPASPSPSSSCSTNANANADCADSNSDYRHESEPSHSQVHWEEELMMLEL